MRSLPPDLARDALEAAPDAMVIIDDAGTVLYANRQTADLFGYRYQDIVGRSIDRLLPDRFRARHAQHRREFWQHLRPRPMGAGLELFAQREDGVEFPVEISLSPVQDGERLLVAAAIRDISERKRAHIELETARQAADRANQGKSRFLATASHDLRQPLQTLALLNGTLQRITTDADALNAIEQQEQAINAMSRLLNALLDISKLESGAIQPEPMDFTVATLFEEMRREFAQLAASKGLQLEVQSAAGAIHSDPSLVEQILRNLLSNAIKYTRHGLVTLRSLHEGAFVRLEVLDTGIGIPADQLPLIYDEFYQVGVPTNSSRDGYGLGLSIVQRLVSLLRLRLEVTSELGRGSTFALTLPAGRAQLSELAAVEGSADHHARRERNRHVLLVEDDPGVRNATQMLLRVEGYKVRSAASLEEALAVARRAPPIDAIVSDYHLGSGETGVHVIDAVCELLARPVKAVLMTGDTSSAMEMLRQNPLLRLTSKPVRADELLTLLRELIGGEPAPEDRSGD